MQMSKKMHEFVVDCHPAHCNAIQRSMRKLGFEVKVVEKRWLGDHVGFKRYKSDADAWKEAENLVKKYDKKLYQITVIPPA